MAEKKRLVIIDGKSVFYRGFYGLSNLATSDGTPTGGVYGFAVMALQILNKLKPDYVIVAWDKSKTNIRARRKLYSEYKANRKPMPEELRAQIPLLRRLLAGFSWPLLELDDYEADDIMATLSREARQQGLKTVLVTSDLDVLQAVNGDTEVLALKRGLTNTVAYSKQKFTQEYGMTPEQFIDYKALKGDSSDNVPGVAGVGDKTARELIADYGSLDGVYKNLEHIRESVRKKLEADRDMAYLSHQLLEIKFDAPAELDLAAADVKDARPEQIARLFRELEFTRLRAQLPPQMKPKSPGGPQAEKSGRQPAAPARDIKITAINSKTDLKKLELGSRPDQLLIHTLTSETAPGLPVAEAAVISTDPAEAYILDFNGSFGPADAAATLKKHLEGATPKIGYNLKNDYKAWQAVGLRLAPVGCDVMVAAFLLNPLLRVQSLYDLVANELGETMPALEEGTLTVRNDWAAAAAAALWRLSERHRQQLADDKALHEVARDLEWPLIPILGQMEYKGIQLDTEYLAAMQKELSKRISTTEQAIHKEAHQEFNIHSPQQLQTILFDKLGLPTTDIKKTKRGYSTAASELEKLRHLHPIVQLISDYRELTKLQSTYVEALPKLVDKAGRLHTTFHQTGAQTGRLSSDKPNLQNIPIRGEIGKKIRQAFTASSGHLLVSADYSQFELRLAAVLARDNDMIEAFNSGLDVHTQTAAEIYGVALEDVTSDQRRYAKVINFGIMYGMSPHGLSVATGMERAKAKEFIDKYFKIREGLLEYLDSLKEKAREDGYVETMFGRKRPMPDIKSPNFAVRSAAERAAINMPIQGSAADLMKMAMIKIQENFDQEHGTRSTDNDKKPQMLLQIHDSILLECSKARADAVSQQVKDIMEHVYKLPVKLDVDIHIGSNWGELK